MKYGYFVVEPEEMIGTAALAGPCAIISKLFEDIEGGGNLAEILTTLHQFRKHQY